MKQLRCLLIGVRGHGGEDVYSRLLRDRPPPGVDCSATLGFHASCPGARCIVGAEVALNRLVHRWAAPNMGFRVLRVTRPFDLVHVHTYPVVLFGARDIPIVFSAGSSDYHYLRDYEGWSEVRIRRRLRRARRVFSVLGAADSLVGHERVTLAYTFSEYARDIYLQHGVPADKIRVLYPGFDIPEPRRPSPNGVVRYLFVGRQPARKGGPETIAAFRELRSSLPHARLLYVSDEPPATTEGVEYRPLVPASEVGALYANSDVFVNPTRAEGFGFTNVEAQGYGLPVISTRLGAIPEVVEDGVTGLLVAPGDAKALVAAMRRLGGDALRRAEMGMAARRRFVSKFSLATMQRGLRSLYDEAIDRSRASTRRRLLGS
jgi:glycosyltransferase involved in cell wall biosynthesis